MPIEASQTQPARIGAGAYVVAGLSFIPLIGVLFGLVAIIWGVASRRGGGKLAALIGALGITVTLVIYGLLFYFGFAQRGGVYDNLRTTMAQSCLDSTVKSIEFYKQANGGYPESLEALERSLPEQALERVCLRDPRALPHVSQSGGDGFYYYQRVGANHYYLRGLAPDGKPFSPGALLPNIKAANLGLLIDPP